jgi:putative transcriptional regulator
LHVHLQKRKILFFGEYLDEVITLVHSNLKEILDSRGIKQSHFVRKFGISNTTMSALYRGERVPTLHTALVIANELRMNVEEIWYITAQD